MLHLPLPALIAFLLAGIFALSGVVQVVGPGFVRNAYRRWGFPRSFYRVTGVLDLLAAAFLAVPETRIWGIVLAGLIIFGAVATLLEHRKYFYAVSGMVLLIALAPASLSVPM